MLLCLAAPAGFSFAEEPAPVPVLIGNHEKFSRIVFQFPKLLAYHVKEAGGNIEITFDTKAAAKLGPVKSALIKNMAAKQEADGTLKVNIGTAAGTTFKHYRLQRKIVVDVYASGAMPQKKAPPQTASAPAKTPAAAQKTPAAAAPAVTPPAAAPAPVAEAAKTPAPEAPAAPPPKPAVAEGPPALTEPSDIAAVKIPGPVITQTPPTTPPVTAPQGLSTQAPPATAAPLPPPPQENEDEGSAAITISSLSPIKLAVFERFGALWIATDASDSSSFPTLSGPMASFIRAPKVLKFEGGTAYRYTFPKKFYPQVTKKSLSWDIDLHTAPVATQKSARPKIKAETDRLSLKTKLIIPMKGAGNVLSFADPEIGDMLYVVPGSSPQESLQETRRLADLETLPALTGIVLRPLKDGVTVNTVNDLVIVSSSSGLSVTPEGMGAARLIGDADAASDNDNNRLFDFPNWRMGGIKKFRENKQVIQEKIVSAETPENRAGWLMRLATLYFSNNFGQETLGVLELVKQETPEIEKNHNFIAIRGAANAMSGHYKEALQDLSSAAIQNQPEVSLWIGFAAAGSEQWRMADRSFPKSNRLLLQYPDNIAIPFTIYMAESALRLGHTDTAKQLLDSIHTASAEIDPQYQAAIDYLRGETFSQEGNPEQAIALWQPVAKGLNRLYHTKASLALTRLLLQQKKITLKEAIEQIDNLRFAWRGDGLEVVILHTLGALRAQDNQILAGLQDMKQAADLADRILDDSTPIRDDMKRLFFDLFVADQAGKISPLEAISIYNEFSSLIPQGPEATAAALNFSDYLIRMDLLDRAAKLIEEQIAGGALSQDRTLALGTKLAAVYLLDARPSQALTALRGTEKGAMTEKTREERNLLRARAQSQLGQTQAAIATLSTMNSRNAQRLKADIWWRAQKWAESAAAIELMLPEPQKTLSEDDAALVVNAAVAWKLAGSHEKLQQIRTKYEPAMAATKQASTFGVVTRERGSSILADRESVLKIAGEVDMFRGFLDSYKAGSGPGS